MKEFNNFVLTHQETINSFIDALHLLIIAYLAYVIVRALYERDHTFMKFRSMKSTKSFVDMVSIRTKKKSVPLSDKLNFLKRIQDDAKRKFLLLDEERSSYINMYLFIKYIMPMFILLMAIPQGLSYIAKALVVIPVTILGPELYVKLKQKEHSKSFENHSYKMFKFINNQRSAGVTTHQIITKLHVAVNDKKLEKRLIRFAAEYIANNNYDEAFDSHIKKYYSTDDATSIDNALKLGLEIGDKYSLSNDEEELMFSKYAAYIDHETEKRKLKSVLIAGMYAFTLLGLIGYPLVMDIVRSLTIIFAVD